MRIILTLFRENVLHDEQHFTWHVEEYYNKLLEDQVLAQSRIKGDLAFQLNFHRIQFPISLNGRYYPKLKKFRTKTAAVLLAQQEFARIMQLSAIILYFN